MPNHVFEKKGRWSSEQRNKTEKTDDKSLLTQSQKNFIQHNERKKAILWSLFLLSFCGEFYYFNTIKFWQFLTLISSLNAVVKKLVFLPQLSFIDTTVKLAYSVSPFKFRQVSFPQCQLYSVSLCEKLNLSILRPFFFYLWNHCYLLYYCLL